MADPPAPSDALKRDILAGATIAVILVPQAMAYAVLAGMPPVVGLYAGVFPALAYAIVGGTRLMSVGPVALIALLAGGALEGHAPADTAAYSQLAVVLTVDVAVLAGILAALRAGALVNFIGYPTLLGFNSAAAILTALSQFRSFFGIPRAAVPTLSAQNPWPVFFKLGQSHVATLVTGAAALAALLGIRALNKKLPNTLIVCLVGMLASWMLGLAAMGVDVIGEVPRGLPSIALPPLEFDPYLEMLPGAASVVIVGYASSITVVKGLAAREGDVIKPNRELLAFSVTNAVSALIGAFPVSGSLSRTTVVADARAATKKAGAVAAVLVFLTVFAFGPALGLLPYSVLAAIVIVSALKLIDPAGVKSVLHTKLGDAATMLICFSATLFWGLQEGLFVGIGLGLSFFVIRSARPHTAGLGRIPGTTIYRNMERFEVETCPQASILRIDAPLYFANAKFLEDRIDALTTDRPALKLIVLDCGPVSDLDASSIQALARIVDKLRAADLDLHLVSVVGPVRDLLTRTGLADQIGWDHQHRSIPEAASTIMAAVDGNYCRTQCRNNAFVPCTRLVRSSDPDSEAEKARFSPQI